MYAKNVTERNLQDVAHGLRFKVDTEIQGNRIKFRLKNNSGRYWKINDGRVHTRSVCYHGHYLFFDSLFDIFPDAIVDTSFYGRVRYTKDTYEEIADSLGNIVIREYDQLTPRDQCNCEEQDWYYV